MLISIYAIAKYNLQQKKGGHNESSSDYRKTTIMLNMLSLMLQSFQIATTGEKFKLHARWLEK
jgi:hypothetical protein